MMTWSSSSSNFHASPRLPSCQRHLLDNSNNPWTSSSTWLYNLVTNCMVSLLNGKKRSTEFIWCGLCQRVNCILQEASIPIFNECHCKQASNYKIYYFIQIAKLKSTSSEPHSLLCIVHSLLWISHSHLLRCNRKKFPHLTVTQNKIKKAT